MSEELKQAAQQAVETLELARNYILRPTVSRPEGIADKCLSARANLHNAITQRPAAQAGAREAKHIAWLHETLRDAGYCIDGGKCHHLCKSGPCFRQNGCVPLSGSGLSDDWTLPTQPAAQATPEPTSKPRPSPEWYAAMIKETMDDDFVIGPAFQSAAPEPSEAEAKQIIDELGMHSAAVQSLKRAGFEWNPRTAAWEKATPEPVPFGQVTVRRLSRRHANHVDQYQFYPAGQLPYLDNVDECHTLYTRPAPGVPDGFVLVQSPITEAMHQAACKVLTRAPGLDGLPQRMLDALAAAQAKGGQA